MKILSAGEEQSLGCVCVCVCWLCAPQGWMEQRLCLGSGQIWEETPEWGFSRKQIEAVLPPPQLVRENISLERSGTKPVYFKGKALPGTKMSNIQQQNLSVLKEMTNSEEFLPWVAAQLTQSGISSSSSGKCHSPAQAQ